MGFDLSSPEAVRRSFGEGDTIRDKGLTTPENIVRCDDIRYGADEEWNVLDVYYPVGTKGLLPTIVSVHGGGWVYGDKGRYQFYCMDLAQRGFTVVNFSYRLAPENIIPAAHEDINSVFTWIADNAEEYHIDLDKLFMVGDSAGANLGSMYLALLTDESYRTLYPFEVPFERIRIRGAALNCGVYDSVSFLKSPLGSTLQAYVDNDPDKYEAQMDLLPHITDAYPPCFIMTSAGDFLQDQALPFYQYLQSKGVDCEYKLYGTADRTDLGHVFHLDIRREEAKEVNDRECAFFREILESEEHRKLAREIAAEGIVLLENREGFLPLDTDTKIAVLGNGARHTIRGGTGSGDVNCRYTVTIEEGLKKAGSNVISAPWLDEYDRITEAAQIEWRDEILRREAGGMDFATAYFSHPWEMPAENSVTDEDLELADTVVYVLGRMSGEGADRKAGKGDYLLSDAEYSNIRALNDAGKSIVLVLNTGGIVDLGFVEEFEEIRAVILVSQPGMEGGDALADVLFGAVCPSGRLTDTWASSYDQYPCWDTFGAQNGDLDTEEYSEDIFVGYRWFDKTGNSVRYPFGYGLSYTSFESSLNSIIDNGEECTAYVKVTNTGKRAGKEVVQAYVSFPEIEDVERECKRLVAFAKTRELAPGESATVALSFGASDMMRFDGSLSAYVLDKGRYKLFIGENASSAAEWDEVYVEKEVLRTVSPIMDAQPGSYAAAADKEDAEVLERLSVQDKIELVCGLLAGDSVVGASSKSVPGAAGETVSFIKNSKKILPEVVMADGPAGVRISSEYMSDIYGELYPSDVKATLMGGIFMTEEAEMPEGAVVHHQYATAFPIGTMVAQTWNTDLAVRMGRAVSEEMRQYHVQLWLAPGLNIHRNPLCGRNFEYYSEDPLVSGEFAAAITKGVQDMPGCGVTIKHFACNNQEDNRFGVNSIVSERALREIYLRGFEIAIRKADPAAIMSAYNKINGVYASNLYGICTQVARDEWGFGGIIMTDWTTTVNGSVSHECIRAGNDLIMPGMQHDHDEISAAIESGQLTEEELDRCALRIIHLAHRLNR